MPALDLNVLASKERAAEYLYRDAAQKRGKAQQKRDGLQRKFDAARPADPLVEANWLTAPRRELKLQLDAADSDLRNDRQDEREAREAYLHIKELREQSERFATAKGSQKVEELYRPDGQHSYFLDCFNGQHKFDPKSLERLAQHSRHMRVLGELGEQRTSIPMSGSDGTGFNFPSYFADSWAPLARAGRPVADRVKHAPIPAHGLVGKLPQVTSGSEVEVQAAEGDNVASTSPGTAQASSNYVTLAGQVDVDRQIFERSGPALDMVIWDDLLADYDAKLEYQLINGSGSAGQHLGLLNVPNINTQAYTDASPTPEEFLKQLYLLLATFGTTLYRLPTSMYIHPRRYAWLANAMQTDHPLFDQGGPAVNDGMAGSAVGVFAGIATFLEPAIPTNLGSGTNQDCVILTRDEDITFSESAPRNFRFDEILSTNQAVRVQLYCGSMFFGQRQPLATGVISGTGLTPPS